jgi:hypothetical protein
VSSTGSVPDLELDFFTIDLDLAELEVDPYGGQEAVIEFVIYKASEDAGLPDGRVTHQDHFEFVGWLRDHYYTNHKIRP